MSITRVYWIIFILSHFCHMQYRYIWYIYVCIYIYIYIYICIYIYKISYTCSFFAIFNCNVFLHCMLNILRYGKIFCKIDDVKRCDILGAHSESIFPFMQCFISFQKTLIRVIQWIRLKKLLVLEIFRSMVS